MTHKGGGRRGAPELEVPLLTGLIGTALITIPREAVSCVLPILFCLLGLEWSFGCLDVYREKEMSRSLVSSCEMSYRQQFEEIGQDYGYGLGYATLTTEEELLGHSDAFVEHRFQHPYISKWYFPNH